jgi:hypothetical protein
VNVYFPKDTYVGKDFKVPLNAGAYLIIRPSLKGLRFKIRCGHWDGLAQYLKERLPDDVEVVASDGSLTITSRTKEPCDLIRALQDVSIAGVRQDFVEAVEDAVREILGCVSRYKARKLHEALAYRSLGRAEDHGDVHWLRGYVDKVRYIDGMWGGNLYLSGRIVDHCMADMSFMSGLTREKQDAAITYLFEMLEVPPSGWLPCTMDLDDLL